MRASYALGVVGLLLIASTAGYFALWKHRPIPAEYVGLQEPRLIHRADEKMLVVEAVGDPNAVASKAFGALFRAYYGLEGVSRFSRPPAPRARWPQPLDGPRTEWRGAYALPIPGHLGDLPATQTGEALTLSTATWPYGDVIEMLHVGPYSNEQADIERLWDFAADRGYEVIGDHEEEYVRGPGMIFGGDPDEYLTVIRLRVNTNPRVDANPDR
jgi:hypothetical protein